MVRLACEQLSVALGGRTVLEGIELDLSGGALVGVIGPNGAGKSTLVRALLGLILASAGRATIDGTDVAATPRKVIARRVAYLPQGQSLAWPLSVARLVALGRLPHLAPLSAIGDADRQAIERAMARTDVAALADRTATELSGGERSRALLARALAVEAPALIVDEPLASLDPGHAIEVMELLRAEAASGTLVIAVLHDLTLAARYCDRLVLLDRGRLVADGDADRVLTAERLDGVYGISAWVGSKNGTQMIVPTGLAPRSAPSPK